MPKRIESDNRPPFNSREYETFAKEEGFDPLRIPPGHLRANGESKKCMQTLNKTECIAALEGKDKYGWQEATHDNYASGKQINTTPSNKQTPYKLDHTVPTAEREKMNKMIDLRDFEYKDKMKGRRENRNTTETRLIFGDHILVRQQKRNKWSIPYEPVFYTVISMEGSKITACRTTNGRSMQRCKPVQAS